jgi:hypothetical protein
MRKTAKKMKRRRRRSDNVGYRAEKSKTAPLKNQGVRHPTPAASGKGDVFGFMAGEFKIVGDVESVVVPLRQGRSNLDVRETK